MSVIVAPILPGFELSSLGDPQSAARQFLATLAPEGSGLTATLISASARTMPAPQQQQQPGQQQQLLYYTLEYTVQGPKFFRHNVSVYTARWGSGAPVWGTPLSGRTRALGTCSGCGAE